jgi:hypothetical protein
MATQQANALFHTKTLNKALKAFTFPPDLAGVYLGIERRDRYPYSFIE